MDFIKLPENSEKLLLELIQADNPVHRHLSETMMNCAVCLENCAKEDISMCSGQIMYPITLR